MSVRANELGMNASLRASLSSTLGSCQVHIFNSNECAMNIRALSRSCTNDGFTATNLSITANVQSVTSSSRFEIIPMSAKMVIHNVSGRGMIICAVSNEAIGANFSGAIVPLSREKMCLISIDKRETPLGYVC